MIRDDPRVEEYAAARHDSVDNLLQKWRTGFNPYSAFHRPAGDHGRDNRLDGVPCPRALLSARARTGEQQEERRYSQDLGRGHLVEGHDETAVECFASRVAPGDQPTLETQPAPRTCVGSGGATVPPLPRPSRRASGAAEPFNVTVPGVAVASVRRGAGNRRSREHGAQDDLEASAERRVAPTHPSTTSTDRAERHLEESSNPKRPG